MLENLQMLPLAWQTGVAVLLGLLLGSFLNVVIHRLPLMLERQWQQECAVLQGQTPEVQARYDLLYPPSACVHCQTPIRAWQNIPVFSFLLQRGKCASCGGAIAWRYPLVELVSGLLLGGFAWQLGLGLPWLAASVFCLLLLAMTLIDAETQLLPDDLTLLLLWAGLLFSLLGVTVPLADAVVGAMVGYLSLWSIYWLFKLATGKEGMGFGDFKLFAALGAWFGWQALVPIILMASVIGALVGIGMKLLSALREGGVVPFGPFLALGGITAMVLGPQTILRAVGL